MKIWDRSHRKKLKIFEKYLIFCKIYTSIQVWEWQASLEAKENWCKPTVDTLHPQGYKCKPYKSSQGENRLSRRRSFYGIRGSL